VIRGTKKLRGRVKGPAAADDDHSTTELGDWFATALFWRPQVVLLVNTRTFLRVFMELAPAATLLDRAPAAIEEVLLRHGVNDGFLAGEREAMSEVRIGPTNDRSVLGVMNEFAIHGEQHQWMEPADLVQLSVDLASTLLGPLDKRGGSPDRELASLVGGTDEFAKVIPLRPGQGIEAPAAATPARTGDLYQLKVTLHDTKPPIWRRVLIDGASTLDQVHEVIQAAFGWWNYHLHEFEIGNTRYGVPDPDEDRGPLTRPESRCGETLARVSGKQVES